MAFRHIILDSRYRSAWGRTLQLWKPLAIWTLFVWLMLTIVVVPATTALVHIGLIRGDQLVISNSDILHFILSPKGAAYLLLLGSLGIITSVVRFAGIFQIVTCQMKNRPITVKEVILQTVPSVPRMFRLAMVSILLGLLFLAVIAAGFGLIYLAFLSGHDINYYLMSQPVEWRNALIAGGVWLLFCFVITVYSFGRMSAALPAFLDCNISIRRAILNSWETMGNRAVPLLKMVGFTLSAWFILLLLTEAALLAAITFVVDQVPDWLQRYRALAIIAGIYFIITQGVRTLLGFLGFSFLSVLITKFYHEDSQLKMNTLPPPGLNELKEKLNRGLERYYTPMRALLFVCILIAAGLGTGAYLAAEIPAVKNVKILAHRAGPRPAPENTVLALKRAIEIGADAAEIDVMRTADGTVIAFHDSDLMRMANDPRQIRNLTYPEITELGIKHLANQPQIEAQIPTLEQILVAGQNRIDFMIELKYYWRDPELLDDVLDIVGTLGMRDNVAIASQDLGPIRNVSAANPTIETGYISALSIGSTARLPVQFIAVQHQQLSSSLVRSAIENNMNIYAWTVNQPGRVAELINLGVDGIITDDPEMAIQVKDTIRELSLAERLLLTIIGWQPVASDSFLVTENRQ
ncbi:MAG: hypothetical protein GVY08_02285 [Bacteroidetes bacterium]|jgi:glycerophosphoryl diester phosphodiesterase|nr:hypothetical protein [Bacteroidota bacterium]